MWKKLTLGKILIALTLFAGALGGMPMKPEEIEELMRLHSLASIVVVSEAAAPENYKHYC